MGNIAVGERNKMLDALAGRADYVANTAVWVKLHIGDPGAAGTSNPAAETTRKQVTFGSAAASGAISNTVDIQWTALPADEVISHVSLWTASTGGTWLGNDALLDPQSVNEGGSFTIPTGDLDLTVADA